VHSVCPSGSFGSLLLCGSQLLAFRRACGCRCTLRLPPARVRHAGARLPAATSITVCRCLFTTPSPHLRCRVAFSTPVCCAFVTNHRLPFTVTHRLSFAYRSIICSSFYIYLLLAVYGGWDVLARCLVRRAAACVRRAAYAPHARRGATPALPASCAAGVRRLFLNILLRRCVRHFCARRIHAASSRCRDLPLSSTCTPASIAHTHRTIAGQTKGWFGDGYCGAGAFRLRRSRGTRGRLFWAGGPHPSPRTGSSSFAVHSVRWLSIHGRIQGSLFWFGSQTAARLD